MVQHKTADRACNMLCHLMIREGALDWLQIVRSNDVIWGLPYNLMQWTHLQEYVANLVGVPVGRMYWLSDSMHMYGAMVPAPIPTEEVQEVARWDEARRIREFDLYKITGCWHAPMGLLEAPRLETLAELEHYVREGQWSDWRLAREGYRYAELSVYWKNVLDILLAHKLYLAGNNEDCLTLLSECPDRVYALAQMRFYTHMRWGKENGFRKVLEQYYRPDLVNWLMGTDPQHP